MELNTLQGEKLKLTVNNGGIKIGDALITQTGIPATNGVIHAIDSLLVPPGLTLE